MAITYTKLDTSRGIPPDKAEEMVGSEWKYNEIEKSVEREPFTSVCTYMSIKKQLDALKVQVSDLEEVLVKIEEVAK